MGVLYLKTSPITSKPLSIKNNKARLKATSMDQIPKFKSQMIDLIFLGIPLDNRLIIMNNGVNIPTIYNGETKGEISFKK